MTIKELCKRWRNHAQARRGIDLLLVASAFEQCAQDLEFANETPSQLFCPDPSLKDKFALVLYFDSEKDSRELIEAIRKVKPHMVEKPL